jgi:hypothetical protein
MRLRVVVVGGVVACFGAACGAQIDSSTEGLNPGDVELAAPPVDVTTGACPNAPAPAYAFDVTKWAESEQVLEEVSAAGTVVGIDGHPVFQAGDQRGCVGCCERAGSAIIDPYAIPFDSSGISGSVDLLSPAFHCSGNTSCDFGCSPFSTEPHHRYRFIGLLSQGDAGSRWTLDVQTYCLLPDD